MKINMKKIIRLSFISFMFVLILPSVIYASETNLDDYLIENGISSDIVKNMTKGEKSFIVESAEKEEIVPVKKMESFLIEKGVPKDVLQKMNRGQMSTIYGSLLKKDSENIVFEKYEEQITSLPNLEEKIGNTPMATIPRNRLKISVTVFYSGNNLQRYTMYPSFEWINGGGTNINADTFAYALNDNYWTIFNDADFNLYAGNLFIKSFSRPSNVGFSARAYKMNGPDEVVLPYNGTGEIVARPKQTVLHRQMLLKYGQSLTIPGSVSFGPFSITLPPHNNEAAEEIVF